MIPMPEPLPDKPRIAGGFDFQAKQLDKPRFCSKKRRRTTATNLRRLNARRAAAPLPRKKDLTPEKKFAVPPPQRPKQTERVFPGLPCVGARIPEPLGPQ